MPKPLNSKIETFIHVVRGQKVMLDVDLASLYGVATKTLNQAVSRNCDRFPEDFMFQLTDIEREKITRSQIVTASRYSVNLRFRPHAFTERGIAMLSGVLKSPEAIQVHISIIRIFFKLREALAEEQDLAQKLEKIERSSDHLFKVVFERLDKLESPEPPSPPRRKIGF